MRQTTILIAGFGRFPGAPFNPSGPLARALARRRRPALRDARVVSHVFATSYAAVDRDLPELIARHRPDVVLLFGLATRAPCMRVEVRARNACSSFPDVTRFKPASRTIEPRGPAALRGAAPFVRLVAAARSARVPARLSRDAGRYLCNYSYWHGLKASRSGTPLVQFIHIPPTRRISHARLLRAGEAILLALMAAQRR